MRTALCAPSGVVCWWYICIFTTAAGRHRILQSASATEVTNKEPARTSPQLPAPVTLHFPKRTLCSQSERGVGQRPWSLDRPSQEIVSPAGGNSLFIGGIPVTQGSARSIT